MEAIWNIVIVLMLIVALKAILGFHFPWEPYVKNKKLLSEDLESIKSAIPQETYDRMVQALKGI